MTDDDDAQMELAFSAGEAPEAQVNLTFERVFCARHREPFRAKYPSGVLVSSLGLLEIILNSDAVLAEARQASGEERPGPEAIEVVLDKKPACCRVSERQLLGLYEESGIGEKKRCRNCKRKALGAPYKTMICGVVTDYDHICFRCVVHAMEALN